MIKITKILILLPFLLCLSLFTIPTNAEAKEVTLEKPKLFIDESGKVDVKAENGTVKSKQKIVTEFIAKYRVVIAGISGIGTVSMILFFIIGFLKLGAAGSNPEARSRAIAGLISSGVGAAGLGAVALITGLFFNAV